MANRKKTKETKDTARIIEISDADILALADGLQKEEPREKTVEEIRSGIVDYPSSIRVATFFKAFGDATRLRILHALGVRDLCVKELCELLGATQPAVSNHLRILSQQGIVKPIRRGKNIYYSLDDWHINAIIGVALERFDLDVKEEL